MKKRILILTATVLFIILTCQLFVKNPIYNIALIAKTTSSEPDFWRIVDQGAKLAAKEFNTNYEFLGGESESDIDGQIEIIEKCIRENKDAIVLAATDYNKLADVCKKAYENGIKIIVIDSDLNADFKETFIATDNIKLGESMAEISEKYVNESDKFAVIAHIETSYTARTRLEGILNVLGMKNFIGINYCNGSIDKAYEQTIDLINKNADLKYIFAINETSAIGAARAINDYKLKDEIVLISCDSSFEQITYLENGIIKSTVIQKPFNMGYLGVKSAIDSLNGLPLPDFVDTETVTITVDNMYDTENQKLLFYSTK